MTWSRFAEAYSNDFDILELDLDFTSIEDNLTLLQNRPNPFKDKTLIGFSLPEAETVTLRIVNMDGKILDEWSRFAEAGYNEWAIQSQSLPEKGILYYQLMTRKKVLSKKMMVLE